ncbi:hypothetical protein WG899_05140 [Paucibacter sp. AS339]|uniref:hypothetical protein n=1 Tax=Paucibacter hankyongi TaxID=3133434 RepID=UPI0030A59881
MQEAHVADFINLKQQAILQRSRAFYALLVGGFFTTVGGGLAFWVWGVATGQIKTAVIAFFILTILGFLAYVLAHRSRATCALCKGDLEVYVCAEDSPQGRYSGNIFVCRRCNAYDVYLTAEFD